MSQRHWARSGPAGGIVGVFAGAIVVLLFEWLGHRLLGTGDPLVTGSVTTAMIASVLVAWILGSAVAGWVATYWSRSRGLLVGGLSGSFLLLGSVGNFFAFPHPPWMIVAAIVLMPAAAFAGAAVARVVES